MGYVLLFFLAFPFLKILPLESYNQPYAILTGLAYFALKPGLILKLPRLDRWMLTWMAVLGIVMFLVDVPSGIAPRDFMFLLSYCTPFLLVPAAVFVLRRDTVSARRFISISILAWVAVALVQRLIDPGFLGSLVSTSNAELGLNQVESGRGVLSLAPESTHHGLHILALGAAALLIGAPIWVAGIAVGSSMFLALSSSAFAALAIGSVIWMAMRPWRWLFLLGVYFSRGFILETSVSLFEENTRLGSLLRNFSEQGFGFLLQDYSVSARFYGMVAPIRESFTYGLLPIGIAIESWDALSKSILENHPEIDFLSTNGPASGIGLLIVQGGFLALPVVFYIFYRFCLAPSESWRGVLACSVFMVFMGQFYLSTPTFSLVLAALVFRSTQKLEPALDTGREFRRRQSTFGETA